MLYEYSVKDYKVIDGDTIDVLLDLGFNILTWQRCRLNGINTPELHTLDPLEAEASSLVLQQVKLILDKCSDMTCRTFKDKQEKYGRYLIELDVDYAQCTLNQMLLDDGFAKKYDGKWPRPLFSDHELKDIIKVLASS